jgi:hypothetical protein
LPKKERRINTLGNKSYRKQREVTVNKSIPFKDSMRDKVENLTGITRRTRSRKVPKLACIMAFAIT